MGNDSGDEVRARAEIQLAKYTKSLARYTLWLTLASVAAVSFTAWIAFSTRDLRDLTLQQAKDTQQVIELTQKSVESAAKQANASVLLAESAKVQAEAAKIQAESAKGQSDDVRRQVEAALEQNRLTVLMLEQSSQSAKKQNQPYGYFLPYMTNRSPEDKEVYGDTNAVGNFQNVGGTPMTNVQVWSISGLVDFPFSNGVQPELFDEVSRRNMAKFASDGPQWDGGATIGTNKVHTWPINVEHHPFSDSEIKAYDNGDKVFYVEVVVFYKDTYGQRHKDKDCVFFKHEHHFNQWTACYSRRDKL